MDKPILTMALTRWKGDDGSVAGSHPGGQALSEPLYPSHHEPYLVVWLTPAAYRHELITVLQGGHPLAQIGTGCCLVVHPHALDEQGSLTEECRNFLIGAVQNAVNAMRFRMCLVWSSSSCAFVEIDGSVRHSFEPPSGGIRLPQPIAFDCVDRTSPDQSGGGG